MKSPPRTTEEAEQVDYKGSAEAYYPFVAGYGRDRCAWQHGMGHQCHGDPGHGPGKIYCKQHARIVEACYEGGEK